MSKVCSNCKSDVDSSFDYCPRCGKSAFIAEADPAQDKPAQDKPAQATQGVKSWKIWAVALVVLAAVVAANSPNPFRSKMEYEDAKLSEVFTLKELRSSSALLCDELSKILVNIDVKIYKSRKKSLDEALSLEPRAAVKYRDRNSWVDDPDEFAQLQGKVAGAVSVELESLILQKYPALSKKWVEYQVSSLKPTFQAASFTACPSISSELSSVEALLGSYDDSRSNVRTRADAVPWYPNGYSPWTDSNIAWKWYSTSCNLGDSCWHMKVTTLSGCPDGLYGEINILDGNGAIVDYSNDIVPRLEAGQTAVLEFSTYTSGASKGQLSKLQCN